MGYELISALSALDLSQGCNYLPTPALTLHTHHMRGEEIQEGGQLPLLFPPSSYRFRRLSSDVDLVSLFFFPFHRVWQLERTGQGSGQQKHSSCGSKSPVLPSPEAGPPGMWQSQPIFPDSALAWGLNCPFPYSLKRNFHFSVVREADEKESLRWQPGIPGFPSWMGRDVHPALLKASIT